MGPFVKRLDGWERGHLLKRSRKKTAPEVPEPLLKTRFFRLWSICGDGAEPTFLPGRQEVNWKVPGLPPFR